MKKNGDVEILMSVKRVLKDVTEDEGLYINYAQIYYAAMKFLRMTSNSGNYEFPINIKSILDNLHLEVIKEDLNDFMKGEDFGKVNRIIGKVSIRPDYLTDNRKISIYIEEKETPAMINYALAHELCHLILNYDEERYSDDYCTMPMLPKVADELVADAFAIFLLIPLDKFIATFRGYVEMAKSRGNIPIRTEEWLNYLGLISRVPYYYVTCAYEHIRHATYIMYRIHKADDIEKEVLDKKYGREILELYSWVVDELDEETINILFQ